MLRSFEVVDGRRGLLGMLDCSCECYLFSGKIGVSQVVDIRYKYNASFK